MRPNFNPLSLHGERLLLQARWRRTPYFNPLSLHGERQQRHKIPRFSYNHFNPLSLHGERPTQGVITSSLMTFQSTLPAWGETAYRYHALCRFPIISIHSPCMGRDQGQRGQEGAHQISIHSPCMGRDHGRARGDTKHRNFNPLSLHGERRPDIHAIKLHVHISIHSPCMGRDAQRMLSSRFPSRFQSTLPAWGETSLTDGMGAAGAFQSTLPAWGETV